jgi:glucose/arabinose dehydrogenase
MMLLRHSVRRHHRHRDWVRRFTSITIALALLAGCTAPLRPTAPTLRIDTQHGAVDVVTVAAGLEFPWSLAFLPDGRMLVTERPGRLRVVSASGELNPRSIGGIPPVDAAEHGGLLDVAVHPRFAQTGWIYLAYVPKAADGRGTEVMRARLVEGALRDPQVIFRLQPKSSRPTHYGARLAFDRNATLFITLGDRSEAARAQRLDDHAGKVIRLLDDGRVPADNPFAGDGGVAATVLTLGHRNVQGAAMHPRTGQLWITEHGESANDRFARIDAGANYGWPQPSAGGTRFAGPAHTWTPTIAPSGLAFYVGEAFPQWRDSVFVGSLKDRMLVRLQLAGDRVVTEERLLKGALGRVRDVRTGPDGMVYLLIDDRAGRLIRLQPAARR